MKINAGTKKMKVDARTGQRLGWRLFKSDAKYQVQYRAQICQTVLVVKNGPDKGLYAST